VNAETPESLVQEDPQVKWEWPEIPESEASDRKESPEIPGLQGLSEGQGLNPARDDPIRSLVPWVVKAKRAKRVNLEIWGQEDFPEAQAFQDNPVSLA